MHHCIHHWIHHWIHNWIHQGVTTLSRRQLLNCSSRAATTCIAPRPRKSSQVISYRLWRLAACLRPPCSQPARRVCVCACAAPALMFVFVRLLCSCVSAQLLPHCTAHTPPDTHADTHIAPIQTDWQAQEKKPGGQKRRWNSRQDSLALPALPPLSDGVTGSRWRPTRKSSQVRSLLPSVCVRVS